MSVQSLHNKFTYSKESFKKGCTQFNNMHITEVPFKVDNDPQLCNVFLKIADLIMQQ